ncbi:MAG TPA: tRNA pseudouridine(55) synthase TruB [Flavitalea sp.]|nr:tRNA pseudouridine(55) synthase TruB [Flavitalea sp.]
MISSNPYESGRVLFIDKPYEWTSFDVVRKLRGAMKIRKVGHAGTLDPLATGLLILCTGNFTRKINEYMTREKEYTGCFVLGATTATYDLESEPVIKNGIAEITEKRIHEAAKNFIGTIEQVPPAHSAIKIGGKRLYEFARKGKEVTIQPRKITISEFEITRITLPRVEFRVVCSTGTYIRSLANDFGAMIGSGAYLASLCRTRIGEFMLEDAKSVDAALEEIRETLHQKG